MVCPNCQRATSLPGPCPTCGTESPGLLGVAAIAGAGTLTVTAAGFGVGTNPGATTGTVGGSTAPSDATDATDATGLPGGTIAGKGPLRVGHAFGPRYHIIKVLGVGGMGAVYQAWDAELSVAVALKVIRTDARRATTEAEKRFKQELLLARQVTHRNVVRIHDLGQIEGMKYLTMSYVQGMDLATVLRRDGKLPIARALFLARQIAEGLQAAHDASVVHRDLKPPNIMIGADDLALIMDFGISVSAGAGVSGGIVGTLDYMAPEQATGASIDARADIYAFGLILHEMLSGPRTAVDRTPQERFDAMKRRIGEGVPPLRSTDPSIPAPLDALVARCLEREPSARFASAGELVAALNQLDDQGELIPVPARITRRTLAVSAIAIVLALVGVYVVGRRAAPRAAVAHAPVSVVIADLTNNTGDPSFDHVLEPMLKLALEGAGFVSAYDRSGIARNLGVRPPAILDERAATELAVKQGLGMVLSGSIDRQGAGYGVSVKATEAVTGKVITTARDSAPGKDAVVGAANKAAAVVRKALGDTSESAQRFATQTFSATSLEVVRAYAEGAEALSRGRSDEALRHFSQSVALDPNFGLGWAGMGVASRNLDRQDDAERNIKEAVRHLDGMTERERFRTRGLFYYVTGDYQQCVKEYGDLIAKYSADAPARNNLALCLTHLRSLPRALDEMRQVTTLLPKRDLYRENMALYADYSGDFKTAEQQVRALPQPTVFSTLALAFSQLLQGRTQQAAATYQALGKIDAQGASYGASGLADMAVYEGRYSDAVSLFTTGASDDLAAKDPDRAADKFVGLAHVQILRQQKRAAAAAADRALANSKSVKIRFLAARVYVESGDIDKAKSLSSGLASELQPEPQAYAKILDGSITLQLGDARQAIKTLTEANALLDTWIGHFELGRAYLAADAFTQADSEFDRCIQRRGEALALFLDEEPTSGFFPPVHYYQGRLREGLHTARFVDSYRTYLSIRGASKDDPLVPDVRRRAQ